MSDRDPLADLLRRHDLAVDPSPAFADRLEERLLAELGPAAAVATARHAQPIPLRGRRHRDDGPVSIRRPRWFDVAAAAVLLVGLMGGGILGQLPGRGSFGGLGQADATTVAAPVVEEAAIMGGGSPARDYRFGGPGPVQGELIERWSDPAVMPAGTVLAPQVFPYGDMAYRTFADGDWDTSTSRILTTSLGLHAYHLDSGAPAWSRLDLRVVDIAAADAGIVVVLPADPPAGEEGTARSRLALLDRLTGVEMWSYALPATQTDSRWSPIIDRETVYYADVDATVYALDLRTGTERWVSRAGYAAVPASDPCPVGGGRCAFGHLVLGDDALYVVNSAGTVAAIQAADGTSRWTVDLTERYGVAARSITYPVAVAGGLVLSLTQRVGDPVRPNEEAHFVRLDQADGAHLWEQRLAGQGGFYFAADEARVFVSEVDAAGGCCALVALDLGTGQVVWRSTATRLRMLGTVRGGDLYAIVTLTMGGTVFLYALDPATGRERWQARIDGEPILPLAADGSMLVSAADGFLERTLMAYRPAAAASSSEPTIMTGGSPARDNRWPGPGLSAGELEARWTVRITETTLLPEVLPFRDLVYAVIPYSDAPGRRIEARDLATGELRWSAETESSATTTVSAAGVLIVEAELPPFSVEGQGVRLRTLDLATGAERWRYETEPATSQSYHGVIVAEGTVYYVDPNGVAYALDAETGAERWLSRVALAVPSRDVPACDVSSTEICNPHGPAYRDGVLYLINSAGEVYALDARTGDATWSVDVGERYGLRRSTISLIATGRGVVVNMAVLVEETADSAETIASRTALLDARTGDERWTREIGVSAVAAADDERLYLYGLDFYPPDDAGCCPVVALDLATGATVWTMVDAYGYLLGLVGGDVPALVRIDTRHEEQLFIVGHDPETGAELWRLETSQDYPVLPVAADGTILVQESDGALTAFRLIPDAAAATPEASPVASPVAG